MSTFGFRFLIIGNIRVTQQVCQPLAGMSRVRLFPITCPSFSIFRHTPFFVMLVKTSIQFYIVGN